MEVSGLQSFFSGVFSSDMKKDRSCLHSGKGLEKVFAHKTLSSTHNATYRIISLGLSLLAYFEIPVKNLSNKQTKKKKKKKML
jgi:hypothetical protein